ncbi:MAG: histidinol-phosphate transaminase [Candidatus Aminicenantes bacterium]|nr:MAG: histidinol-phosphate transaminase [Candidatus Aminicenantes bacterium]
MRYALNRRQWIKTSALALAGLMTGPGLTSCKGETSVMKKIPDPGDFIMLHNNESPFGISPIARKAITGSIDLSNRYPHRNYTQLIDSIAEREDIPPDHIILGAGSTDVMVTLIHLVKKEGEILVADPTYFDFIYYANLADRPLNRVRLNDKYEHDLETMEKQISPRTDLIYVCNPNNPTGSITPKDKLQAFCEQASKKTMVVVDEAYHEYVQDEAYASMIDLVKQAKNIIVTRTFSKIFALAGLRIGYGIAHPEILKRLHKLSRNFAPVAWLSLKAAVASHQDQMFIQSVNKKNNQAKAFLYEELDKLGLSCIPSHTNFVLFKIDRDARELAKILERKKILIRPFVFHDSQWIRVSCGTKEELQTFISSLGQLI